MNKFFKEASKTEIFPYEGLTTSGATFTSLWMDTNGLSDTYSINTVTQRALPVVNPNKNPNSTSFGVLAQTMSPTDKVDSWFSSTPTEPGQSSTSCPSTRDTALNYFASDQIQLSNQKAGDASFESTATDPSAQAPFPDSFFDSEIRAPLMQLDASTGFPGSWAAHQSELSTPHLGIRDPFFDSVPKGPSQLSTSRWEARALAFDPWSSARGQTPASSWNKTETPVGPGQRVQGSPRPRLSLRIPNASTGSDNFRSAPQMATHTEISDQQADAPHTTDSSIPAARLSTPFQGPQRHATRRGDTLNPTARPFHSKSSGPRAPARRTNPIVMQPTAASHTNSRTWTSKLVVEKERWQRVEDSLGRMNLLRSSVVPKTLKDWLAHQRDRTDAKKEREQRRLEGMNLSLRDPRLPPPGRPVKIGPAFRGRAFEHKNYSSVLVFPSVWARMYEAPVERPDPLWPCVEEMKEEGDERNTSGFRRFPALPRVPGNDTVQYKLKAIQPFLTFDTIWELPTKESIEAANEKYSPEETKEMEGYLGGSLLDALDCITGDSF